MIHKAKAEKLVKKLQDAKEKEAQTLETIAKSTDFLEKTKIEASRKLLIPWATLSGCPKCRWKKDGSTCCNPEKMTAKNRAVKIWQEKHGKQDEKFDKDVYNSMLEEVYQEMKLAHTSVVNLSEIPQKAGGYWSLLDSQDS